jgi:hypothetical protein
MIFREISDFCGAENAVPNVIISPLKSEFLYDEVGYT